MTRNLVLLEYDVAEDAWRRAARLLLVDPGSRLLTDHDEALAGDVGLPARTLRLPDLVPLASVSREARGALAAWAGERRLAPLWRSLGAAGPAVAEVFSAVLADGVVAPVIRAVRAVERALAARPYGAVHCLRARRTLLTGALRVAAAAGADLPAVREVRCQSRHPPRPSLRRLVDLVTPWTGVEPWQEVRSLRWGVLRRPAGTRSGEVGCLAVVSTYPTLLREARPVLAALAPRSPVHALAYPPPWAAPSGVATSPATAWLTPASWAALLSDVVRIRRAWRRVAADARGRGAFAAGALRLWPVLGAYLEEAIRTVVPQLVFWSRALGRALDALRPRSVLAAPEGFPPGQIASVLARERGIPSLGLQAWFSTEDPYPERLFADRLAAIDVAGARTLARAGLPPERVVVTGHPAWDGLARARGDRARGARARTEAGLAPGERFVLFLTQVLPPAETRRMVLALARALAPGGPRLVLKTHPVESPEVYASLLAEARRLHPATDLVTKADLPGLLVEADLVATAFSVVAVEAAILGRPVLAIELLGHGPVFPFAARGIAAGARTDEEILARTRALLEDASARRHLAGRQEAYFRENPQLVDGGATARVVEALESTRARGPAA